MKKNGSFVNLFLEEIIPARPPNGQPNGIWKRMELLFIKQVVSDIEAEQELYHVYFKLVYICPRSAPQNCLIGRPSYFTFGLRL
ncbi:MAG: hypothetical protein ABJM11_12015 [Marinobacter sp.]|uniref:hypothetical protein n=1 Tax=Marinobacter sp. TaxID=50741 RepID=UPI003299567C